MKSQKMHALFAYVVFIGRTDNPHFKICHIYQYKTLIIFISVGIVMFNPLLKSFYSK